MLPATSSLCDDLQSHWYETPLCFLLPQTHDDDECWWFALKLSLNSFCQKLVVKLITMTKRWLLPPHDVACCCHCHKLIVLIHTVMRLLTPATSLCIPHNLCDNSQCCIHCFIRMGTMGNGLLHYYSFSLTSSYLPIQSWYHLGICYCSTSNLLLVPLLLPPQLCAW